MLKDHLKILLVEDSSTDVILIEDQLSLVANDVDLKQTHDLDEFKQLLASFNPDIIISDYRLMGFNGMDVLQIAKRLSPETTFVFVTGTIDNEELAANTILSGASGYILKTDMELMHMKLLPHLKSAVAKKSLLRLSPEYKEMFAHMKRFIQTAERGNQAHIKSCIEIKSALEKLKQDSRRVRGEE